MKKQIYILKDEALGESGEFLNLFLAPNENYAIRQMKNAVNDSTPTDLTLNTKDFKLYRLGELDFTTGEIKPKLTFIANLIEYKEKTTRSTRGLK